MRGERGGALGSPPLLAQAMRDQVAPGCTAVNLVLLSIQCPFPFPPPFSVSQQLAVVDKNAHTIGARQYTVKKVSHFPVPSRDVTDQTLPGRE